MPGTTGGKMPWNINAMHYIVKAKSQNKYCRKELRAVVEDCCTHRATKKIQG